MDSKKIELIAIVAMDKNRLIGKGGTIPWSCSEDMKFFAECTTGHTVMMGRKTFDSLPTRFKPLPNRLNVVVSRSLKAETIPDSVEVISSIGSFLSDVRSGLYELPSEKIWVIGGGEIYRETLNSCDEIYVSVIPGEYSGDTFFPEFEDRFELVESRVMKSFEFKRYRSIIQRP